MGAPQRLAQRMTESYLRRLLRFTTDEGAEQSAGEEILLRLGGRPAIVLGEPGMGKSELLRQLGARPGFHYVTARKFLRRRPGDLPGEPGDVLVIDALDEVAAARDDDPVQRVLTQLAAGGYPSFVLSCRSVDWRGVAARQDIQDDYELKPLELRLEPLSESEAQDFLAQRLDDAGRATEVVTALARRGLARFYGTPLTLDLIAKVVMADGSLPASRAGLFDAATDLLRKEHDEKRSGSALTQVGRDSALDAAGAAMAALIITGSEAISLEASGRVDEADLHVADVAELPGAGALRTVLGSGLFVRPGAEDRAAPLHRAVAEYLGARWLAAHAPEASARRLLSLLTFNGGAPASLRGIHAWLAHFDRDLAPAVIATDPYGVLRYGDASGLGPGDARRLLDALQALSGADPHFRSEDWARHEAPALVQPAMLEPVRGLLTSASTGWQLRLLVLEALDGAPITSALVGELATIVRVDGLRTYAERRAATAALASATEVNVNWNMLAYDLARRADPDARRLAVEVPRIAPSATFSAATLAHACLGYLGLLPGVGDFAYRDTVGPLYVFARSVPTTLAPELLDRLAAGTSSPGAYDWRVRHALKDLTQKLIERQLDLFPQDPVRLLAWMRICGLDQVGGDDGQPLPKRLRADHELRRALQHRALFVDSNEDTVWGRAWRLQELAHSLHPTPDDMVILLRTLGRLGLEADARSAAWRDLVQLMPAGRNYPKIVADAAKAVAGRDADLRTFLRGVMRPPVPEWQKTQRRREQALARAREKRRARDQERAAGRIEAMRAGEFQAIHLPALAYFNRIDGVEADEPRARISAWLGDDVLEAALEGFEATLHSSDLPTSTQVAESYAVSKYWPRIFSILAGLCERVKTERGLGGLSDEVLIVGRMGCMNEAMDDADGGDHLADALDAALNADPALLAAYATGFIEPQLTPQDRHHVRGLYHLARLDDPSGVLPPLAAAWLDRPEPIPHVAELELVDLLIRRGAWATLRDLSRARRNAEIPREQRLVWLAVAFLSDFTARRADLDVAATQDPELFWHIRNRGGAGEYDEAHPHIKSDRLAWLVRTFRGAFPATDRPGGVTSGDDNPWDASSFLVGCIQRIAADTSDAAMVQLDELLQAPADGYTTVIRSSRAAQLKARRESDFEPAQLGDLVAVMRDRPPRTASDLKAILLDALERVQRIVRGDEADAISNFYEGSRPKGENACRDQVLLLMRGQLPFQIDVISERDMPGSRRADLVLTYGGELQVPLEAKGQWHPELWTAITEQLEQLYTIEYRAGGVGVYLVFWFGAGAPTGRRLTRPPERVVAPTNAEELREALVSLIPDHRRADLSVFVLDLSREAT